MGIYFQNCGKLEEQKGARALDLKIYFANFQNKESAQILPIQCKNSKCENLTKTTTKIPKNDA